MNDGIWARYIGAMAYVGRHFLQKKSLTPEHWGRYKNSGIVRKMNKKCVSVGLVLVECHFCFCKAFCGGLFVVFAH